MLISSGYTSSGLIEYTPDGLSSSFGIGSVEEARDGGGLGRDAEASSGGRRDGSTNVRVLGPAAANIKHGQMSLFFYPRSQRERTAVTRERRDQPGCLVDERFPVLFSASQSLHSERKQPLDPPARKVALKLLDGRGVVAVRAVE